MKQELVSKWKVQFSLILMWNVFWKKKRIFPWFYQHCVSTMLVELSVDLSKSFLISRKGTFVIFKSERERVEVRPQLRYEGRQNWLSADGEFWDVCFPSVCLHFSITWRYLWHKLNMRELCLSDVMINGIYPLEKLCVFQITTHYSPPSVVPIYIDVNIWQ